jgi:hypothetical protein
MNSDVPALPWSGFYSTEVPEVPTLLHHESLAQRANDKRLQQGLLAAHKTNFFSCFDLLSATRDPSIHAPCLRCTPVIPASAKAVPVLLLTRLP